jgi:rhodanese-related sulfurtransferase
MLETHQVWQEKLKRGMGMLAIMLVVAMSLTSCSATYKNVTATEAQQLVREKSNLIILDVRTQAEYDSGYIPNALLIPVDELADRLGELDMTKPILVYSQNGVRSAQASQIVVDNGFSRVYNLEGGIIAWQKAGAAVNHLPIIKSLTSKPSKVKPTHECTIECTAQDPDGDELSYAWSASGGNISGEGAAITWTAPDKESNYDIAVVVGDGKGGQAKETVQVRVGCG